MRRRKATVELFEEIRREYEFGVGTIQGVARKFGVHRRLVREAFAFAAQAHEGSPAHHLDDVVVRLEVALHAHPLTDAPTAETGPGPPGRRPTGRNRASVAVAFADTRRASVRRGASRGPQ